MNPILLRLLQAGKVAGSKAVDVGRVAKEMATPAAKKIGAGAKNIGKQAGNAAHYAGTKAKQSYQRNPSVYQAGGAGALGGLAIGAGINDNQNMLEAMFENFDTSGVMAMSEQNISKWTKAGVDEDSARWLGMIDTVHERRAELEGDEQLANQFGTMLSAMNVNYLDMDLDHHNQKREKAGFDPIQAPQEDMREGSVRY
jgi:hypothetical protein